jgi:putative ubiquitin-RnfH superfamily antitoxin RatB of RatAB toxin-antitoxin module
MEGAKTLAVEVAYASPQRQTRLTVEIAEGATVAEAIQFSGITRHFPEIDLSQNPVGIFGRRCGLDDVLRPGDRVEIYRPLQVDPKEARRARAARRPAIL